MDPLEGLNPSQKEAVQAVEGPLLVYAGPGSGKTRVIVHRIAYMLSRANIEPRHILAVTFSRRAAAEMKKRLGDMFDDPPAVTVSTIHAACLRILGREGVPGMGTSFTVYDEEDVNKLIRQCIAKAGLSIEESNLRRIKGMISHAKVNGIDPEGTVAGTGERFDDASAAIYRLYQAALKKGRALDYDDMLVFTSRLLKENGEALQRYQLMFKYILVDEFQDTSSLQYQIIRMLGSGHGNVCVVGDPDQTIYSWRQAEVRNADIFCRDFPGARVIDLEENYRSTQTIVYAANALIARNSMRRCRRLSTSRESGSPISVIRLKDGNDEAHFIAARIKTLAVESNLKFSDFAVLYRINAQSRALEDAFNLEKMPYKLVSGTPFYKRSEVMDLAAWLRVIRNPADDAAFLRVIKLAGKGMGAQTLAQLQELAGRTRVHLYRALEQAAAGGLPSLSPRARSAAGHFNALLQDLHARSRHINLVAVLNLIVERTAYQDHLKGEDNAEERWENVLELISLATAYEHLNPLTAVSSLLGRISQASDAAEAQGREDSVTFNTLHGSKGSEFRVVFIAGVEEGLLPHSRSSDEQSKLEEERRLFYVGISRAMDTVYLTHTEKRLAYGEFSYRLPSRFLRELPAALISSQNMAGPIAAQPVPPQYSSPVVTQKPGPVGEFRPGEIVRHRSFGDGRVTQVIKQPGDFHVIVVFDNYGVKKFLSSVAALEKIT
jgi:DNA helicase-2/ATP-dependent DNA helicase PcrA